MNDKEIWKNIDGYDGLYKISSRGRVFSCISNRIKPSFANNKGYHLVHLYKAGFDKSFLVHRLVALAFCENPHGYKEINHIDEDKSNNFASNLEWCSRKYNQMYSGNIKKWADAGAKGNQIASSKAVVQCDLDGNPIKTFTGLREAFRMTGIFHCSIMKCCQGKQQTAGGYKWHYLSVP